MLRTEALQAFLHSMPYEVARLYTPGMEVQVNVSKDDGDPISGTFKGKTWRGYTDGLTTWKSFRIPWNASTVPRYEPQEMRYDISKHAESIGMTGWDYLGLRSRWVAFDFDSIIGHKQGLTDEELKDILERISTISWVTVYSSTSGVGFHIYVYMETSPLISNHNEHAELARAILSNISALSGIKLESKVDTCGGNMWVWAKRADPKVGFQLIKKGELLEHVPTNWKKDSGPVSSGVSSGSRVSASDNVAAAYRHLDLEDEHTRLLKWFEQHTDTCLWWWDTAKHMLVCHSYDLKLAHTELKLQGIYDTLATGKDKGHDQNSYCFPEQGGGWIVRRHTRGIREHDIWFTDSAGWTCCRYNELPTVRIASQQHGGVEGEKEFSFPTLKQAYSTISSITGNEVVCPPGYEGRPATLRLLQGDNKLILSIKKNEYDNLEGWAEKGSKLLKSFFVPVVKDDLEIPDELIRHIVASGKHLGWMLRAAGSASLWVEQSKSNIQSALSNSYKPREAEVIIGRCILNHWSMVNKPFYPEYPGNREWNADAPQLRYQPFKGLHPNWDKIFNHLGSELDIDITDWCKDVGLVSGSLYLQCWVACLFQEPQEPLPYLAFYGGQNTGKSTLHEALSLLCTKGIIHADAALLNPSGFNGELSGSILCIIEETDLSKSSYAANRIKDWVTAKTISIHIKGKTPYEQENYTHWIQCTNDPSECPVFSGDTRIVMVPVCRLSREIPKSIFMENLESEAPAFLYTMLNFDLPESVSRLRLPTLETEAKAMQQEINTSSVALFIAEQMHEIQGATVGYNDFFIRFSDWHGGSGWTKQSVGKELIRLGFPKGKSGSHGGITIGNLSFEMVPSGSRLRLVKGRLK